MTNDFFVHESAVLDEGASIGGGTTIWHFSHVMRTSVIGQNCTIGQNVFIDRGVTVGNGVKIQNNVSVYKGVCLEDHVFIGPSVVFTNVINPRSFVERKHEFRSTSVRTGATIGANATILCGVEIGEFAMIGAGAVITADVKPYALVIGNPGKQIGWVSKLGNTLNFTGDQGIEENGWIYYMEAEKIVVKATAI
jgi:UDP-2-acetamido-3-amino-2,3-dideoxy-glucuronate N-acetyltransferase